MGKTKYVSAFELGMVVGPKHTYLSVSRTAKLLGFSHSTVSRVYQEWSTIQRTSRKLDTTVGRIGVNIGQDPRGMRLSQY
jgi:predicted alpha/beta hydrolase